MCAEMGWAILIFGLELYVLWGPLRGLFPNSYNNNTDYTVPNVQVCTTKKGYSSDEGIYFASFYYRIEARLMAGK